MYDINYKQGAPLFPISPSDTLVVVRPGQVIVLTWDAVRTKQDSNFVENDWDKVDDWNNIKVKWQPSDVLASQVVFQDTLEFTPGAWKFRIWSWLYKPNNSDGNKWFSSSEPSKEVGILIEVPDDTSLPMNPVMFPIKVIIDQEQ
jgi:hypothetical protein